MHLQILLEENTNLRKQVISLNQQLQLLQEQLEWFKRQLFGKRSEKIIESKDQLEFFKIEESKIEQQIKAHKRVKISQKNRDNITLPEDLPVETQILDLPQVKKICPETGKPLIKIGEEISRKLAHKPGSYYIKEIIRPKYALPQNTGILIHTMPEGIIPRSQADESLLAEIFTKKFAEHLPLYRINEILAREGIGISRQLLSQWVVRCGQALKPLYYELEKQILKTNSIFIDETTVNMQKPGKGKVHQAYMWVVVGKDPPYRYYYFTTNRNHENAKHILKDYKGIVHSDKYGAYEKLASQKQFIWAPCFAHIRRKFFEAETGDQKFREWVLRKLRYLFMFEKIALARTAEERLEIRKNQEIPILEELIEKVKKRLLEGTLLPKSNFKEALSYFCGLIPYLKNYTQHANAHIDNNTAERAMRPLAIGRKNWLFIGSEKAGESAAVLLSLVQSCRSSGINPRVYLEDVMRRLMDHSAQKLNELLPVPWALNRNLKIDQYG